MVSLHSVLKNSYKSKPAGNFRKNLALSYQNKEKHRFSKRMWPFGQNTHTHTHTQVKSPPSDPCAI